MDYLPVIHVEVEMHRAVSCPAVIIQGNPILALRLQVSGRITQQQPREAALINHMVRDKVPVTRDTNPDIGIIALVKAGKIGFPDDIPFMGYFQQRTFHGSGFLDGRTCKVIAAGSLQAAVKQGAFRFAKTGYREMEKL